LPSSLQVESLLWGNITGPKAALQPAAQSLPSTLVPESLVIFCIARLEVPYIEEWVLYHLHIGVDFIYIYDNEEVPTYGAMFLGNPRVLVIPYSEGKDVMPQGQGVQYEAIYHFLRNYKDRHTWALHIDVDEFVYLKRHKSERSLVTAHGLVSNHWLRPSGPRVRHGVPALLLVLCSWFSLGLKGGNVVSMVCWLMFFHACAYA
jgi:hypothetical protein